MGRLLALPAIIVKAYDLTCKDYTWLICHIRDEHSSLIVFKLSDKDTEFYWIDACISCWIGNKKFLKLGDFQQQKHQDSSKWEVQVQSLSPLTRCRKGLYLADNYLEVI